MSNCHISDFQELINQKIMTQNIFFSQNRIKKRIYKT